METGVTLSLVGIITALITLVTLVTKYFIKAIGAKDDNIMRLINDFNTTVNHHIRSSNDQLRSNTEVMHTMVKTMETLPDKLAGHIINGVSKLLPIAASQAKATVTVNTQPTPAGDPNEMLP